MHYACSDSFNFVSSSVLTQTGTGVALKVRGKAQVWPLCWLQKHLTIITTSGSGSWSAWANDTAALYAAIRVDQIKHAVGQQTSYVEIRRRRRKKTQQQIDRILQYTVCLSLSQCVPTARRQALRTVRQSRHPPVDRPPQPVCTVPVSYVAAVGGGYK